MDKLAFYLGSGILLSAILFPHAIEAIKKLAKDKLTIPTEWLAAIVSVVLGAIVTIVYIVFMPEMFKDYTTVEYVVAIGVFLLLCIICSQQGYDIIYKELFERNKESK